MEKQSYSCKEALEYCKSWRESLELRRVEIYSKYMSGTMSGIILIVITIGLSFDKLAKFGVFEKSLLAISLVLLIVALGNIMHGNTFTVNAQLNLLALERKFVAANREVIPKSEIDEIEAQLVASRDSAHSYFPYAYWSVVLAIILGIIGFFTILIKT